MDIVSILRSRLLLVFLLLNGLVPAMAQVKFTTIVSSKEISKSDYVQIEFVVENAQQIEQLAQPSFPDFQIVKGPIQSSGMSIVNGVMSQYKALSFVLQPNKTGKFTIPGATANIDGKLMHSNSVTILVNPGGSGGSPYQAMPQAAWPGEEMDFEREYVLKPGEDINEKIRKNLFVKVQLSKTSCYVGEPIVATYKLYSRLQSESRVTRHPSLNGFSVYDMIDPTNDASFVEKVNGKPFTVHVIRKAQLIPLQAGTVDLDPVEIDNTVHFIKTEKQPQRRRSSNPIQELFDRLSGDSEPDGVPIAQHITLESKPVAVAVRALPEENKPADFNGAVGNFTLEASLNSRKLAAEDAGTLKLTLKGTGNLPVVNAPVVQWPAGVETYDPTASESIDKTVSPMAGSKTFEYKFIPSSPGNYTIPEISFSYFDPSRGAYKTLSGQSMDFLVSAAKPRAADHSAARNLVQEPSGKGIADRLRDFVQSYLEWIFAVIILSGLAFFLFVQYRRAKKLAEEARVAEEKARKMAEEMMARQLERPAIDPLQKSREFMNAGNYREFYAELNRAIWQCLGEHLQIRSSSMNKHNIAAELELKGWDEGSRDSLLQVLNECEVKLYTPDYRETDMHRILADAEIIIRHLGANA